jgi:hypothetical protein
MKSLTQYVFEIWPRWATENVWWLVLVMVLVWKGTRGLGHLYESYWWSLIDLRWGSGFPCFSTRSSTLMAVQKFPRSFATKPD